MSFSYWMMLANRWPECFADRDVQFPDPQAALNHAMELHRTGKLAEAENLYLQLQQHFPQATDLVHLIGLIEVDTGRKDEGFANLRRVIALQPNVPHYHANLGARLLEQREAGEALACLDRAIELQPDTASHHYNRGNALLQLQRWSEALATYRLSLSLQSDNQACELQLGLALHSAGLTQEAIAHYRDMLHRRPADLSAATNLGAMLQSDCDLDGAAEAFQHALRIEPNNTIPLNNLAVIHKELGETGPAIQLLRRCVELQPDSKEIRSNLILIMHYDPATTDGAMAEQHAEWNRRHIPATTPHANPPIPTRKLRIGFISPDLRDHVVGRALLPSLTRHDRSQFEIFCYAGAHPDAFGQKFRDHADGWRETTGWPADLFARRIREDQIDILVDLSLHTSDNRLDVFALKPAPVQVSWLGYPESSGLSTMDYRLTDAHLEPPTGNQIAAAGEKACLLPDCWTCYEPPSGHPAVNDLPSREGRPFTFGSLNNSCKINDQVLGAWARILLARPDARLLLLAKQGSHRRRFTEALTKLGVAPAQICFADYLPSTPDLSQGALLARYHEIDLALDTFPYGGMTTTLDALWMGVPVVSLIGQRNLGRAGLSILSNVGLQRFAVDSVDAYVETAVRTSKNQAALAEFRSSLRGRMQASPLLDAEAFTYKVETAFRSMWRDWCNRQTKSA
jgi:predicted O-linked N-acetylglucosamine transferase (SPINDLY family)